MFQQELTEEPIDLNALKNSADRVQFAWTIVSRNAQKVSRFKAKYRTDFRDYLKKLAYFCAREVRKKFGRCQKLQKEYQVRAKKLSKEA
jgi:DNA helicase INO80